MVGLEVKRELVLGELRDVRRAALPIAAAAGGMIAPAALYLALESGQPAEHGWGIPMATDIAFVVGCMAVLGKRLPQSLRVMLLSLAIADDIGAILVIALGYASGISLSWLAVCALLIAVVYVCARIGVRSIHAYWLLGAVVWFACYESGVHATIAGVVLGLMTPARSYVSEDLFKQFLERAREVLRTEDDVAMPDRPQEVELLRHVTREAISPLEYLEAKLHPWVSFGILPAFALANAGVAISAEQLTTRLAAAVMIGLVFGKPLGIIATSWLAVKLGLARLPDETSWGMMIGAGCLAGIGFTMALFIAGIALEGDALDAAKIGILTGSLVSAIAGMAILWWLSRPGRMPETNQPVPAGQC